jgi:hypothetical protein
MSRQPWPIKPSVIKRILNGVQLSNLGVKEVKFGKDGSFTVIPVNKRGEADAPAEAQEDLKELL